MKKYIFVIVAFLLFFVSPKYYSIQFCWLCCALYLLESFFILSLEIKRGIYFSFNLLFLISLFCTTFIVPLFVLPKTYFPLFGEYANKGTAMVVLAVSVYYVGWYNSFLKKGIDQNKDPLRIHIPLSVSRLFNVFSVLITIVYLIRFFAFLNTSSIYENDLGLGITYTIIQAVLVTSLVVNTISKTNRHSNRGIRSFIFDNLVVLVCSSVIILSSMLIGDRTMPIYLGLGVIAAYVCYVKRLSLTTQWAIIICAAAVMFTIGRTRHTNNNFRDSGVESIAGTTVLTVKGEDDLLQFFSDFLPATSALYMCQDWRVVHNGALFYPGKIIKLPFSPFPYLPTLLSRTIWGVENSEMSSASLTTAQYNIKVSDIGDSGLGTHAVGDIYVSYGLLGVIVFFYFFGWILGTSQSMRNRSINWALVYIALLCNAIYIPRASLFNNFRTIIYELFFLWLVCKLTNSRVSNCEDNATD